MVDLRGEGVRGVRTPRLWSTGVHGGCKNDVYPNSNQLMLRNSVGYH